MKWFLIKGALWIGLVLGFIFGYGSFCDYFFQQRQYLDLSEKKQWVLAQQGGSYDYAVLGSSRAYGAFDMNLLDSLTGWDGINLGSNGSGFKDNYLVLSLFLKSNTIKRLFLQVDMSSLNSKSSFSNEFHAFTFLPYWDEPEVKEVLQKEISLLDNSLTTLFPQWRYFYFNKYFSPKEVIRRARLKNQQDDLFTLSKGGIGRVGTSENEKKILVQALPCIIDPKDWMYFMDIINIAEAKEIEIVFFIAPRYMDNQAKLQFILSPLPNSAVFPGEFDIYDSGLFQDQGHLNNLGRQQFTLIFQKKINPSKY